MAEFGFAPIRGTGGYAETNPIAKEEGISPVLLELTGKWKTRVGLMGSEPYWKAGQTIRISEETAARHTLCIGGTGSGKTTLMFRMFDQIYRKMTANDVAIIFDSKGDYFERFGRGKPAGTVRVLGNSSKYTSISEKWNIFRDIQADGRQNDTVRINAMEIARTLFAQRMEKTNNAFFPAAAQDVLASLLTSICWDAKTDPEVAACMNNAYLTDYLQRSDASALLAQLTAYDAFRATASYIEGENEQSQGVVSELHSVVREVLLGVFALDGEFSIREFVRARGKKILFVEYDLSIGSVLTPIYRLLIDLALKEALSQMSERGRVFLFLDEFRLLPHLRHIDDAVNFGRSKGLRVFAGLQSIEQLYDLYGQSRGRAIAAGFSNVFSFRSNDEATMKYVSGLYGSNLLGLAIGYDKGEQHLVQQSKVIPDWSMSGLEPGQAVVCLSGKAPFVFHFDK